MIFNNQIQYFQFRFFTFLFHQKFKLSTALQWQRVLCILRNTTTAVVLFGIYDLFLPQGSAINF